MTQGQAGRPQQPATEPIHSTIPYGRPAGGIPTTGYRHGWTPGTPAPPAGSGQYASPLGYPPAQLGFGSFGPSPARRPPNPLGRVVLSAAAVVAVGCAAYLVWALVGTGSRDVAASAPSASAPSAPASAEPAPTSTPEPSGNPGDPVSVPAADLDPDPVPIPETVEEAWAVLKENPFYDQSGIGPIDCAIPLIDPTTISEQDMHDHLNQATACLWRAWVTPVRAAGFELPRPPVVIYSEPITTACGGPSATRNAYYCSGDQRIYYAMDLPQAYPAELRTVPYIAESVLGHEFGHALQGRTGIIMAEGGIRHYADSKQEAKEVSRRTEVQADCLNGMFLVQVAQASQISEDMLEQLRAVVYESGDDRQIGVPCFSDEHGTGEARQRWWSTGRGTTELAKCNTFLVDAELVR